MLEHLPDALGHALRNRRAGLDKLAWNRIDLRNGTGAIQVASLAFIDHGPIPALYTADGDGRSPPLHWSGIPPGATSLVLIVEDADAPTPQPLVHAIVVDLEGADGSLAEGAIDTTVDDLPGTRSGRNSYLMSGWLPPDPPPGHGSHRYAFQLFALGPHPGFSKAPGRDEVLEALTSCAIASGCLIGCYERPDGSVKDDASEPLIAPLSSGGPAAA